MLKLFVSILYITIFSVQNCGAEKFSLSKISDWQRPRGLIQIDDTTLRVIGKKTLYSKQIFKFDKTKSYSILGEFKASPGTDDNYIRVGIRQLDENKKLLCYHYVHPLAGSNTRLIADAKASDKIIMIADGAKWRIYKRDVVAFNTNPQGTDLPNRNIIKQAPVKIQQMQSGWVVSFDKPIGVYLNKGIGIRLHMTGGSLRYIGYGSSAKGLSKLDVPKTLWEPGVKYFCIAVLANCKKLKAGTIRPKLDMKNINLEVK